MVCVGLDTNEDLVPICIGWKRDPVFEFNKTIIDTTHPLVCAYKFNFAFYAGSIWPQREAELIDSIEYIHKRYPDIPVILDGKFGDIGNSSEWYAKLAFEKYKADAVTVNPYFGQDSLQPFLERKDKGIIVLCKTSNPGAAEFQDLVVSSERYDQKLGVWIRETPQLFYCRVAYEVAHHWNENDNCLLVVGATYPEELGKVRKIVGDLPILVPGVGVQSGDLLGIIKNGPNSQGFGLIIHSSRGVIYAFKGKDFAEMAGKEAKNLRNRINKIKEETWKQQKKS